MIARKKIMATGNLFLLIGLLIISVHAVSQEFYDPMKIEADSIGKENRPLLGKILYPNIMISNFSISNSENQFKMEIPDFNALLKSRWIYLQKDHSGSDLSFSTLNGSGLPGISPFFSSGTIFNQAAYQISDKFLIGGAGFGARSMFSAPLPGSLTKPYDIRGASMFFQYKVSPHFKIETRVNVQQGPGF